MAVGRSLGDLLGAEHMRGAAAVLDHDLLAPGLGEALPDRARDQIADAAGGRRHHQGDGFWRR